jgi:FlaA1/EpsC-like NDP-sugar epimerase
MFPKRTSRSLIILVDILLILVAYWGAFTLANEYTIIEPRNIDALVSIIPWVLLTAVCFIYMFELDRLVKRDQTELIRKLMVASACIMVVTIAVSFLFREFALPRSVIFLAHFFIFVLWLAWKSLFTRFNCKMINARAVFIGDENELELIKENLRDSKLIHRKSDVAWLSQGISLSEIKEKILPYGLVFIGSSMKEKKKNDILYYAMKQKKSAYMIPNTNELFIMKTSFTTVGDTMVLEVKPFELTSGQVMAKRILDVTISSLLIIATLPIMIGTAIAIKLEDGGPFFFKQERVGQNHKAFNILKFRSMIINA